LDKADTLKKVKKELKGLKGIYGFLCKINNKLYIGSSENLIKRFMEHINGIKSNINLQRAVKKYGLSCFYFVIFETYNIENNIKLVDLETTYISFFKSEFLYNFKLIATSMLGYKHNNEAKWKMKNRFKLKKHPQLGKPRSEETKLKIKLSVSGKKNPMFGRTHKKSSKILISAALSKPVYLYRVFEDRIEFFDVYPNSVEIAKLMNLHKSTTGRYIKSGKILIRKSNKYILRRSLLVDNM